MLTPNALTPDIVTVKLIVPIFSLSVSSLIEIVGCASSFSIVPTPWLSAMFALTGLLKFTVKVSLSSLSASSIIGTSIVVLVLPAGMVTVPLTWV